MRRERERRRGGLTKIRATRDGPPRGSRSTRRVSVFGTADCEKCIVLSREIGVVKYSALSGTLSQSRENAATGWGRRTGRPTTGVVSVKDNLLTN